MQPPIAQHYEIGAEVSHYLASVNATYLMFHRLQHRSQHPLGFAIVAGRMRKHRQSSYSG